MLRKGLLFTSILSIVFGALPALAEEVDKSRIPPLSLYHTMFDANKEPGLVQFRNYDGKQVLYFTALQTLHCRLNEIRFSINSTDLDRKFDLVKCNPQTPFNMPPGFELSDTAITLKLGEAKTVAVQAVWENGQTSEILVYEPCKDVGDQTCAWPVK